MKKIISYILIAAIFALPLSGCGADETESADTANMEQTQASGGLNGQEGSADPESILDASAVLDLDILDNSLDAYSRIIDTPLQAETPAGALAGGESRIFLGATRAYYFKKHLFSSYHESWDEISFVTAEGETGLESFDFEHQLWNVGPVAGTDHYVALDSRSSEDMEESYFLTERDENHEAVREVPLDFLKGRSLSDVVNSLSCFAMDSSGTVHLIRQTLEGRQYMLVSPEGKILTEYIPEEGNIRELLPLSDGRIAFLSQKTLNDEARSVQASLQYMDAAAGEPTLLAAPKTGIYRFTLLDEDTLVYADKEGVYRCDLSGNSPEPLYLWRNHGIITFGASAIQTGKDGRIYIIYESSENDNYLCLEPTTREVEICEITMAVAPYHMSDYESMVAKFNKKYPGCRIVLEGFEYNDTALLTQLTAGQGPVLILTDTIPFQEHEKLWEPLDTFMEQMGIAEELVPSVLELGRINGTLYGVVQDFCLRTLVTGDPELKDWNYETFLQCVESRPELEGIYDFFSVEGDHMTNFVAAFLNRGIHNSYLLDAETGTTNFDSREFRSVLKLAEKYFGGEDVPPGSSLLEGKVLCNEVYISKPEQIALYRSYYGDDANYIGYPTKDGAAHFISATFPLAVRRTATREEKAVAGAFLSMLLSYEGQTLAAKDLNFELSVRRDVLEEQIASMDSRTTAYVYGFDQFTLGSALNVDLDRRTLLDMIDTAKVNEYYPAELMSLIREELGAYFSGTITEDMLIDHLENRVGLWLKERN